MVEPVENCTSDLNSALSTLLDAAAPLSTKNRQSRMPVSESNFTASFALDAVFIPVEWCGKAPKRFTEETRAPKQACGRLECKWRKSKFFTLPGLRVH